MPDNPEGPAQTPEVASPPRAWSWLPTLDGALRRDAVWSVSVERFDGEFEDGNHLWAVEVKTAPDAEPVRLRPNFFDADELSWFVDQVFPGAAFSLLPPDALAEASGTGGPDKKRKLSGRDAATIIRTIGEGLGRGDAYVPDQGYRPPPGAAPRMI